MAQQNNTEILEFATAEDFLYAGMKGKLYGYIAVVKIDTKKLQYPVKIEVFHDLKSFRIYTEPKHEPQPAPTTKAKKKLSKGAIAGIVCGCVALVAIIVGLAVGLSGCAGKIKCIEYNEQGICVAEEVHYKVRG